MNRHFLAGVVILVCLCSITANSYACEPLDIIIWDWIKHMPLDAYSVIKTEIVADVVSGGPVQTWQWLWQPGAYDVLPVFPFETHYSRGRFMSTGKYYVYVSAESYFNQWDSDWAYVYVFEMDLGISNGGFVPVNNDDDNGNGTPDKDDPGPVTGEDDLVAISLSYEPSSLDPGYIELKVGYSNNNIRVWTDSTKGNLVIPDGSNYYKRWPVGTQPSTLYVEGVSAGTAELWLLYSSHWNPDTPVYPGGEYNHDSVDVTVFEVEITEASERVLVYTGSEVGNEPTETATAVGTPSGGTYSWSRTKNGSGDIEFVSGQTSSTVTIRGTAPSWPVDDVELNVTYTKGGFSCESAVSLTVRKMSSTTYHAGNLQQTSSRSTRYYYHKVKDQFNEVINQTGIPCDETVTKIYGEDVGKTAPGVTAYHSSDGVWTGGIAVKDTLSCLNNIDNTKYDQQLTAGEWGTSPDYYIWLHIYEGDQIWKTTH